MQFITTDYNNTIDSLLTGEKTRLESSFYKFNDKPPTPVTFFNINEEETTLDEALQNSYNQVSPESGFRFNKIENVLLYGIPMNKIELDFDQGEFGTEANPIEGECYLPPNTFKPLQNSYFVINYLSTGKTCFFKVTKVNVDTLPNGANFYQIAYKLDLFDADIDKQVVKTFKMVSGNIGTSLKSVVEETTYDLVYKIQEYCDTLRNYYMDLFFKHNVQTFIYRYGEDSVFFYDPFMIEFLIRNKIMNGKKYEYISHQTYTPPSFNIDYDNTFFKDIEKRNNKLDIPKAYATLIEDPMSLMSIRLQDYYSIAYTDEDGEKISGVLADPIDMLDADLITGIMTNQYIDYTDCRGYFNIIIAYMNNKDLTADMVNSLDLVRFVSCKELFYTIPLVIFCMEKYASKLFSVADKKSSP